MKQQVLAFIISLACVSLAHAQTASTNSIDLLWQAEVYTPTFYLGHSQPSSGSTVRVAAMPNISKTSGGKVKSSDLVFTWQKDGNKLPDLSGRGKDTLEFFTDTSNKTHVVKVSITTQDELVKVEKEISIKNRDPKLAFYEDDPLTGVGYHQAVDQNYNLTKPEVTLLAEPYYFSTSEVASRKIAFNWTLNGKSIVSNPSEPRQITFATPDEGGAGENTVELTAENRENPLQKAMATLLIKFGLKNASF
jgi:hypothetical protein